MDTRPSEEEPETIEVNAPTLSAEFTLGVTARYGDGVNPQVDLPDDPVTAPTLDQRTRELAQRSHDSTRYELRGEVGRGGMGAVLEVFDTELRRKLAMKVILGGQGSQSSTRTGTSPLTRFIEEAQVTGQLEHPGVVPVHELGMDPDGQVFFTMRLVRGEEFKAIIERVHSDDPNWSLTRGLGVLQKICETMAYAHDKGVVHRDLKPANIMVGRFGEAYVMDWGLAKVKGREPSHDIQILSDEMASLSEVRTDRKSSTQGKLDSPLQTMDGAVMGTPYYMPPEQADGRIEQVGPLSDVYALGAILYHLMSGRMPYRTPGSKPSPHTVLAQVVGGPPTPVHELAPQLPAELVAICEKAMAREPGERYAGMLALAEDLRAYLENRVVQAYRTGALVEMKKWVQRNKGLAASLAASSLVLIGVLAGSSVLLAGKNADLEQQTDLAKDRASQLEVSNDQLAEQTRLAREQAVIALEQTRAAEEQERIATQRADDVLRLSAAQDLEDLLAEEAALWPLHPELLPSYRDWLARARALDADLALHLAKREELRALALPQTEEERLAEREAHPEFERLAPLAAELGSMRSALAIRRGEQSIELPALDRSTLPEDTGEWNALAWQLVRQGRRTYGQEARGLAIAIEALATASNAQRPRILDTIAWARHALGDDEGALAASEAASEAAGDAATLEAREEFQGYLEAMVVAVEEAGTPEALAAASERVAELEQELAEREARVGERQHWRFAEEHDEARWWNAQLTKLIEGLVPLAGEHLAEDASTATYGWSVAKRMRFAERLEAGFAIGGEYDDVWQRELPAIRTAYPGLELTPQLGLLPIGPDPDSGLWEFAHLATGAPAQRGADGRLVLTEDMGLVLVLIPAGSFWMGAQNTDEAEPNYDSGALDAEGPVHEVRLSAYFLSKYEMTQGQWLAATGINPSTYQPPGNLTSSLLHPVEKVSWTDSGKVLERVGLSHPSEAQWEYGARAGTDTVWYFGSEREDLRGKVNIADKTAADHGASWGALQDWPDHEDGSVVHAEVGSYPANSFGLHEVHGNVSEWCLDGYGNGDYTGSSVLDPVAPAWGRPTRPYRGGAFGHAAKHSRSAYRYWSLPQFKDNYLGLRPARRITP